MTIPLDLATIVVVCIAVFLAVAILKRVVGLAVKIAFLVALAFLVLKGSQWAMANLWIVP